MKNILKTNNTHEHEQLETAKIQIQKLRKNVFYAFKVRENIEFINFLTQNHTFKGLLLNVLILDTKVLQKCVVSAY